MITISKQFVFGLSTQEKLHVLIEPVEKNNPRRRALDRNTQTKRAFESMLNYLKFESNHQGWPNGGSSDPCWWLKNYMGNLRMILLVTSTGWP